MIMIYFDSDGGGSDTEEVVEKGLGFPHEITKKYKKFMDLTSVHHAAIFKGK
jgi:hypothetical protein